jgi:hypothetical protein
MITKESHRLKAEAAEGANGRCEMNSMKQRSLVEVIALMGLPAEILDEIPPIEDSNFARRATQLMTRAVTRGNEPPPTPPRRVACRALPTRFAYEFEEIPPAHLKKLR